MLVLQLHINVVRNIHSWENKEKEKLYSNRIYLFEHKENYIAIRTLRTLNRKNRDKRKQSIKTNRKTEQTKKVHRNKNILKRANI